MDIGVEKKEEGQIKDRWTNVDVIQASFGYGDIVPAWLIVGALWDDLHIQFLF